MSYYVYIILKSMFINLDNFYLFSKNVFLLKCIYHPPFIH